MADDPTPVTIAPTPDLSGLSSDQLSKLLASLHLGQGLPNIQPDTTPVDTSGFWGGLRHGISLLGEAAGSPGPETLKALSPAEREQAGLQSLSRFGTGLMAASHYVPGQTLGSNLAQGFQAAEHGYDQTARQAMGMLAAKQGYAVQSQQADLERLRAALPLLTLQSRLGAAGTLQNPLTPGAAPRAGIGAGGSIAPFVAQNLPEGVTPEEDQIVRTVIGEAAGQPLTGQQAVAHVIRNRMNAGGQGAQDVIFAANQFEPWNNPKTRAGLEAIDPNSKQYQDILTGVVRPVMGGQAKDPTGGATNFYSPSSQATLGKTDNRPLVPSWAVGQTPTAVIGAHNFYKLPYGGGGSTPSPANLAPSAPGAKTQIPPPTVAAPGQAPTVPPPGGIQVAPEPPLAVTAPNQTAQGAGPEAGTVQVAGKVGAPTAGVIPASPPGSAADVADIQAGIANAQASPLVRAGQPGAVVTAQTGTTTPTVAPIGPLEAASREAYRAAHPFTPSPEQVKTFSTEVDPRTAAGMDRQEQIASNLIDQLTNQYKATGDVKLLTDIATATDKYNTVVSQNNTTRQTQIKEGNTAYNAALQAHLTSLDNSYDKAHENKATQDAAAALQTQTAGSTLNEKRQLDDMAAGRKVTDEMDAVGVKAHTMNSGLLQIYPLLDKLPKGGLGALLQAHPDLLGPLKTAGVISSDTADAVQLIHGLTSYMASDMKPVGLGSLREYEFDAFRARLPTMLESEAGQKQALAMLLNMNDRAQQESQWMRGHFAREVPDASVPGGKRGAYNLAPDNITQMDKALGPIIPHYAGDPTDSQGLATYRARQLPGRPFHNFGVVLQDPTKPMGPTNPPVRDANGRPQMREFLDVAPMQ